MAPRFRQMPTSSYQAITLIPLIRKMIIQILVRRRRWSLITNKERTMRDGLCFSTRVLTRYFFAPKVWFGFPKCNVGVAIAVGVAVRSEWKLFCQFQIARRSVRIVRAASCVCVRPNLNPGWHQPPSGNHLLTKLYQSCSMWRQEDDSSTPCPTPGKPLTRTWWLPPPAATRCHPMQQFQTIPCPIPITAWQPFDYLWIRVWPKSGWVWAQLLDTVWHKFLVLSQSAGTPDPCNCRNPPHCTSNAAVWLLK